LGVAVALSALCGLAILAGELGSFLRAPLGFKDEPLTGLPALAEVVTWPSVGSALVFWVVAKFLNKLSARLRCTDQVQVAVQVEQEARERVQTEGLARSRMRALGWEEGDGLDRAVEAAIRETRATSLTQMGLVIKAVRSHFGGRFDEQELRNVVRAQLLLMQQGKTDSDRRT
jgi:hypothetical protein